MSVTHEPMWREYSESKSPDVRRELVLSYFGLVKQIVSKYRNAAGKGSLRVLGEKDIFQIGVLGLIDAIDRFDQSRGIKFETFATTRIRGAVQDELRRLDWVPRSAREKVRSVDKVLQSIECSKGDEGLMERLTSELSISIDEYRLLLREIEMGSKGVQSVEAEENDVLDNLPSDDARDPLEITDHEIAKQKLGRSVEGLPEQERMILALYYYESLTFKDISKLVGLSESRVFQKHSQILDKLRITFGE